jgi:hypothetical protein
MNVNSHILPASPLRLSVNLNLKLLFIPESYVFGETNSCSELHTFVVGLRPMPYTYKSSRVSTMKPSPDS